MGYGLEVRGCALEVRTKGKVKIRVRVRVRVRFTYRTRPNALRPDLGPGLGLAQ